MKSFYLLLGGGQCQQFMTKVPASPVALVGGFIVLFIQSPLTPLLPTQSLVSLSELRDLPNFNFPAELESAFAVAIETMGPR